MGRLSHTDPVLHTVSRTSADAQAQAIAEMDGASYMFELLSRSLRPACRPVPITPALHASADSRQPLQASVGPVRVVRSRAVVRRRPLRDNIVVQTSRISGLLGKTPGRLRSYTRLAWRGSVARRPRRTNLLAGAFAPFRGPPCCERLQYCRRRLHL